jgi:hypothetical protein
MKRFLNHAVKGICIALVVLLSCSEDEDPVIVATVSTSAVTSITQTTASGGGNVTADGNGDVTARGIVWGTTTAPTVSLTTKTSSGSGLGSFTGDMTSLSANTTYFVRAYATNSAGTAYGSESTFETLSHTSASASTSEATGVTENSASVAGEVISEGSSPVTVRGIVWGTASGPTISLPTKTSNGTGGGSFTGSLTNLTPNTVYFAKSYATNTAGTVYGNQISFQTLNNMATVATFAATSITATTASVEGNVTSAGTSDVTARGIVWNTASGPTVSNFKSVDGSGTGSFSGSLTSLTAATTYYARAYATNNAGTVYGSEVNFTTAALQNLALNFEAGDDYVAIPDNNSLDLTTSYTLEAWVQLYSYRQLQGIVSKYQSPGGNGYMLRFSNADPYDEINFDGMETVDLNLQAGIWYHIAAVNDNGTRTLYVNGSPVPLTGSADFVNPDVNTDPLRIGSDYSSRLFHGTLDEVRIWSTVRTAEQIDANWDAALTGSETGLVAYYPMKSDATASALNTGKTDLLDMTANHNDGTLSGFILGGNTSNWIANYTKPVLAIGDDYLGGKIAYVNSTGHHGIVVSPYNSSDNEWWKGTGIEITTTDAIGAGQANSTTIINSEGPLCGAFCYNTAASVCDVLQIGTYTDWYLPSVNELNHISINRGLLGSFADGYYWSSTQYTADNALVVLFSGNSDNGNVYQDTKSTVHLVRAVRSF